MLITSFTRCLFCWRIYFGITRRHRRRSPRRQRRWRVKFFEKYLWTKQENTIHSLHPIVLVKNYSTMTKQNCTVKKMKRISFLWKGRREKALTRFTEIGNDGGGRREKRNCETANRPRTRKSEVKIKAKARKGGKCLETGRGKNERKGEKLKWDR